VRPPDGTEAEDGRCLRLVRSAPGRRCLCGFAAGLAAELDSHLLQVFTPDDCIGRDSAKHSVVAFTAPEHGQLPG
jgi:hypothetical protein